MQQSCENSRCIGFGVVVYLHSIVPSSCAAIIVHHTVLSEGQNFESPSEQWCYNDNCFVMLCISTGHCGWVTHSWAHGQVYIMHIYIDTPCGYKLHLVVRFMTQLLPDLCTRRFHWLTQHCVATSCCQSAASIAICMNYTRGICYFCARTYIYIYVCAPFLVATFVGRSTTSRCLLGCRNSLCISPIHLPVWTP